MIKTVALGSGLRFRIAIFNIKFFSTFDAKGQRKLK